MKTENNSITNLFKIEFPIISGGMVWCSGAKLAAAVSNCGGLGLIGAGSMHPELLQQQIQKCKTLTNKPFGVNIPLMYPDVSKIVDIIINEGVKIVFTSAGNPSTWTSKFKENGITVVHVVSSVKFAIKAESAGVDAIVAEGFEAGGHNGAEESTTMVLIPSVKKSVSIPVIAAGGIAERCQVNAAFALGADGVQIGTRFALSVESSAHEEFKKRCLSLPDGQTMLCLKKLGAVRMVKNDIFNMIDEAEKNGATKDELKEIVGQRRAKLGIFEGDLSQGFLEIGQCAISVKKIESVKDIFKDIVV